MTNYNPVQQGWQCPICNRVYSPFTMMCYYCGADMRTEAESKAVKFSKIKSIIDNWAVDDDEHKLLEQIADIIGGGNE